MPFVLFVAHWALEIGSWELNGVAVHVTICRKLIHIRLKPDSTNAGLHLQKERTGMIKSAAARSTQTDLDPIDRLEEKVKRLVDLIAQMRADQAKAAEANARLSQDITALRARLAEAESTATEITALRDEREVIRTRVAEMLEQLEAI